MVQVRGVVASLAAAAYASTAGDGTLVVPEPTVKAALRERGVPVPAGRITLGADEIPDGTGLRGPLVLKAFGPGILHKTEVGAVRLGLRSDQLDAAARQMAARLARAGIEDVEGWLVEEQRSADVEVIVGVVDDPQFGQLALLGAGGTLAEWLPEPAMAPMPLSRQDAERLVHRGPASIAMEGRRGRPPLDVPALVELLLAVAGDGGLCVELGGNLSDFECNPVAVGERGVVALDARLVLKPVRSARRPRPPARTDFTALFAPRSVAVVGASPSKLTMGSRALEAYRSAGWENGLSAVHPTAQVVRGVPAYPTVRDIPGGADYVLVAVPAAGAVDVVAGCAGVAEFVQVISGGFRETGAEGEVNERALVEAANVAGVRLVGPNCLGVYSPAGRQTFARGALPSPGGVSIISQSGGLCGDIVKAGEAQGLRYDKVVSVGNAADVGVGELTDWLCDQGSTQVIGLYVEGVTDGPALVRALRRADGRTPVVVLVGGTTSQGGAAARSHTGALATTGRVWDAVLTSTGAFRAQNLEQFLAAMLYLQCYPQPSDATGVLVVGPGGGASVLATDACDRAGLFVQETRPEARAALRDLGLGAGTSVANPVEVAVGPGIPSDVVARLLGPIASAQGYADLLLQVNVQAYVTYGDGTAEGLLDTLRAALAAWRALPEPRRPRLAVVARNWVTAPGAVAEQLRRFAEDAAVPMFSSLDEAATAIAVVSQRDRRWARQGSPR